MWRMGGWLVVDGWLVAGAAAMVVVVVGVEGGS